MGGVVTEGDLHLVYEGTTTNMAPAARTSESSYHDCNFETPAGTKLLSGGIFFENTKLGDVVTVSSAPFDGSDPDTTPDAWQVVADNATPDTDISIGESLVCGNVDGVSYESKNRSTPTGRTKVKVPCPAGKHVLGGGGLVGGPYLKERLVKTAPFDSKDAGKTPDDGWQIAIDNLGARHSANAFAVCAKLGGLTYKTLTLHVNHDRRGSISVRCPPGDHPVGGGVSQRGAYGHVAIVRSSFVFRVPPHQRWEGTVDNYADSGLFMKVTAICHH
jgi:hypothetical protein